MAKWGEDNLSKFLEAVHSNQKANRTNFAGPYAILQKINDCLLRAGKFLNDTKPVMVAIMFLRCQYAYKAAAGMALSGQVTEAFAMIRLALEYAGYALVIFEDPTVEEIFVNRHIGEAQMKAQKQRFLISEVRACIARFDPKLGDNFNVFYQRAIDFGGHPNPHGAFSAMKMESDGENTSLTTVALSTDAKALSHAMKSVAEAGLTVLFIFQHIFKSKFELLGIRAEIDSLRQYGGL